MGCSKERLESNLKKPEQLEALYREDPEAFSQAFSDVYAGQKTKTSLLKAWHARLNYTAAVHAQTANTDENQVVSPTKLVTVLALIAALWVNASNFFDLKFSQAYYVKSAIFFFLPFIAIYFLVLKATPIKYSLGLVAAFIVAFFYAHSLPESDFNQAAVLAIIHMPLVVWSLTYLGFLGPDFKHYARRQAFVALNGEVLIYTGILYIGGVLLLALMAMLFGALSLEEAYKYITWVAMGGLVAGPIVATHLANQRMAMGKLIAPVLAAIFSPMVLITLLIFVGFSFNATKNIYTDRDALLTFNIVLLVVLALITFTLMDKDDAANSKRFTNIVNILLCACVLGMDIAALGAILIRLGSYGFTPNRIAVLGANVLVFVNLALVFYHYLQFIRGKADFQKVQQWVVNYIPVYAIWVAFVTFLFPLIFWGWQGS